MAVKDLEINIHLGEKKNPCCFFPRSPAISYLVFDKLPIWVFGEPDLKLKVN